MSPQNLKELYERSQRLVFEWLDSPPTNRADRQAFKLLSEAHQCLYAACINFGALGVEDEYKTLDQMIEDDFFTEQIGRSAHR